jgi:hypothetical protein
VNAYVCVILPGLCLYAPAQAAHAGQRPAALTPSLRAPSCMWSFWSCCALTGFPYVTSVAEQRMRKVRPAPASAGSRPDARCQQVHIVVALWSLGRLVRGALFFVEIESDWEDEMDVTYLSMIVVRAWPARPPARPPVASRERAARVGRHVLHGRVVAFRRGTRRVRRAPRVARLPRSRERRRSVLSTVMYGNAEREHLTMSAQALHARSPAVAH